MGDKMKKLMFIPFFLLLASCANLSQNAGKDAETKIGWMHGNCLAIKNPSIAFPKKIILVRLDNKNKFDTGVITKKALSGDECYALMDDRKKVNESNGYYFYEVKTRDPVNLAIGLLGPGIGDQKTLDYDVCSTSEGMRFSVSRGKAAVWKGYYYLGYDTEATCKDGSDK